MYIGTIQLKLVETRRIPVAYSVYINENTHHSPSLSDPAATTHQRIENRNIHCWG